jgi:hypothetical protein
MLYVHHLKKDSQLINLDLLQTKYQVGVHNQRKNYFEEEYHLEYAQQ